MNFEDILYESASYDHLFINQDLIYDEHGNILGKYHFSDISENEISINVISIYPEYRKQGYFNRFLDVICKVADEHHIELELIPLPIDITDSPKGDMTVTKLKKIYINKGFVPEYADESISIFRRVAKIVDK